MNQTSDHNVEVIRVEVVLSVDKKAMFLENVLIKSKKKKVAITIHLHGVVEILTLGDQNKPHLIKNL